MEGQMMAHPYHLTAILLLVGVTAQAGNAEIVRVGVAQTVIEKTLGENRDKLLGFIGQARTVSGRVEGETAAAAFVLVGEGRLTRQLGITSDGLGPGGIIVRSFGNGCYTWDMSKLPHMTGAQRYD
jgi:hypothetical protein